MMKRKRALAGFLAAGTAAALAGPLLAQIAAPQDAEDSRASMVARQPGEIGAALDRWEALLSDRTFGFSDYAGFVMNYPEFPLSDTLRVRAENTLDKEAPAQAEILRYFDRQPPLTNAGRARYALALAGAQRAEAFDIAREAWRQGVMSDPAELYLHSLYHARLTPEDHAARMDALLWQGDADAAARQMTRLAPADRDLAMARLALLRGTLPEEAGVSVPAEAMRDPGYVFALANHLRRTGRTADAVQLLASRPDFARPAQDGAAMVGLMLALAEAGGPSNAVRIAGKVDDVFTENRDISAGSFLLRDRYTDLMWLGGTSALWSLGDGAQAAPLFQRYGEGARSPLTRSKGFYWAGRAARAAGMEEDAARYFEMAAEHPEYYYGQLAIGALGREMPTFAPLPAPAVDPATRAEFEQRPLVRAIRAIASDRRDWRTERRFFEALGDSATSPQDMALVASLAQETGLDEMAVVLGMKAGENGLPGFERIGFPVVETPAVGDWTMVHAISRQESEFDRTRVSHAGARGVMQLMPGTAREQAGKLGVQYMSANLIGDPAYNIRLGDAYFARMMDYYGGAYPLAIGAYNAGPGRVNQWLRMNGDPRNGEIDWVTWVEKIPSNFETRYYIMRVLGNAVSYSHMYPERAGLPRTIDSFLR
ncbi:lytic transglycosylase domain-containing protein [Erythrobacter sp. HL-111]|uniref:lytic transglycosylase domain-containing protein n=1 Tax=Erythrobacter sp. HL-111 TaxID=1798193 RepID=UPI001F37F434|nr:lytic transglycosylase domain-containing protein [Erythrobacter sp. HL-111]